MSKFKCISRFNKKVASLALGLCIAQAAADDIEIYAGISGQNAVYLPNVMFLIDTSGSMSNKDGTSSTRLYKVQEALKQVLSASTDVNVGLMRFSNPGGPVLLPVQNIDAPVSPDERVNVRLDSNDGTEYASGIVYLDDSAISLGDGELHGFRFEDVRIPQGATIASAQLYFGAYEDSSSEINWEIHAELASNSAAFTSTLNDLSNRTKTSSIQVRDGTSWSKDQFTPNFDVTNLVQEVVGQSDWCGGQAMSLFVQAKDGAHFGARRVYSHESNSAFAAGLKISYDYANATGCVSGQHVNQISGQSDNVEETPYGWNSTANVLNMVQSKNQAIGLRFDNIEVPKGATIEEAYLTFTPYSNQYNSTSLGIYIENSDDAAPYQNVKYPVTGRSFGAGLTWSINGWYSNYKRQSPDLSALIGTVTSRPGWSSGNAISFKVVPPYSREVKAYTYKGSSSKSVVLTIKYKGSAQASNFTVRQYMQTLVDGLTHDGWTPVAETMYEAYRYFNGGDVLYGLTRGQSSSTRPLTRVSHRDSYSGLDPVRPSGCYEENLSDSDCSGEYIPSPPTATYISPIEHVCQQNHLVVLTDGRANQTRSTVRSYINALTGRTCSADTGGNLNDVDCGIHLAGYNASSDKGSNSTDARVFTHTISFVPEGTEAPSWLTYLQDMATHGGGDFYPTTDADSVAEAFQRIISEAKKRNTTFVAPSVAISDVNKLLHDSHVYYAVFSPRDTQNWPGNLKKYQIKNGLVLGNSGKQGVDQTTGFFESGEGDFWSSASDGNDEVVIGGAVEQNQTLQTRLVYTDIDGLSLITANSEFVTEELLGVSGRSDAETRREQLLNWILGLDESGQRDYQIGDPLHSAPIVQKRSGGNDVIYFGTNQGFVHAIDSVTGMEKFSFIPKELLQNANDYYENSIFTSRVYGMDGPVTLVRSGAKEILVAGMRRGGDSYYALDVTGTTPSLIWNSPIQPGASGAFQRLGQTWSKAIPATVNIGGATKKVLIFGGGYDANQDNKTTRSPDGIGNAVFMVEAATGSLLWYASNKNLSDGSTYTVIEDMDYSIPADVYVLDRDRDGYADHFYAVDMGGQILRFDIHNGFSGTEFISGGVLADVASDGSESGNRRFFYPPEVAYVSDDFGKYFAVAVGTGYRAHPLNEVIQDRFYVIRDYGVFNDEASTSSGKTKINYTVTQVGNSDLLDATNVIDASDMSSLTSTDWDAYANGFYIRLSGSGEKVLSSAVVANYKVAFTTYIPGDIAANPNVCSPPEGNGRAYVFSLTHGRPVVDFVENPNATAEDRYINLTHGGIPSSPKVIYSEQDLPVICVSSECTNASVMYDSDGDPIKDENAQGNEPNALNSLLPPTNRVYRDSNWKSSKEVVPEE